MKVIIVLILFFCSYFPSQSQEIVPGHAHNDYDRPRPLFDALEFGFISVEADVHLVDGVLYVSHDKMQKWDEGRTLEKLYLIPLSERVKQNGNHVYSDYDGPFFLLIDIKSNADSTFEAIKTMIETYREMLNYSNSKESHAGPVTILLSGNRPVRSLQNWIDRTLYLDGRLEDFDSGIDPTLIPLVSIDYYKHFTWDDIRYISSVNSVRLQNIVNKVHGYGCKIRFWGIPDYPLSWEVFISHGIDMINTDDLKGFSDYWQERSK